MLVVVEVAHINLPAYHTVGTAGEEMEASPIPPHKPVRQILVAAAAE